jgi:hypothetical protein
MSEFSWEADVLPATDRYARRAFRRYSRREEWIADAISVAWEFFQTAPPAATPNTLARYAVKFVRSRRHLPESTRSFTGPNPRRRVKPERAFFDPGSLFRINDNPARIVSFRDYFRGWFASLSGRQQMVVDLLASGETTQAAAAKCGCTPGRISQLRRELAESWANFD